MAPGDEKNTNIPAILSPSNPDYNTYYSHFSTLSAQLTSIEKFANSVWDMYDKSDLRVVSGNYLKCSSLSTLYLEFGMAEKNAFLKRPTQPQYDEFVYLVSKGTERPGSVASRICKTQFIGTPLLYVPIECFLLKI